jgi:hypothetical protein
MSQRPRPLIAVRLIGRADVVTTQKEHLLTHFARTFGERATCRASTHPASYTNEIRVYLTVTAKEVHHDDQVPRPRRNPCLATESARQTEGAIHDG